MKKLFLALLFISLCAVAMMSQTPEEVANSRLVKTLDALEKAEAALKTKDGEIEALKKLVKTLEDSQRTPCTLQMEKVRTDYLFWFEKLGEDKTKNKQVLKMLKDVRKQGRKSIASQCGFQNENSLMTAIAGGAFASLLWWLL